jgi:hypothetical protein
MIHRLERGERLAMPEGCPRDLHVLMRRCWAEHPRDRPPFAELVAALQAIDPARLRSGATGVVGYELVYLPVDDNAPASHIRSRHGSMVCSVSFFTFVSD